MVEAKKLPFCNRYAIDENELKRLNLVLSQIDLLNRWLASDKRAMIIVNALVSASQGRYHKEPYQIRDELVEFDKQNETIK